MTSHLKEYLRGSGYEEEDFIPCELCESEAVDIHHIESRGMGGTSKPETFENLMALCRRCHNIYGDKKQYKRYLKQIHQMRHESLRQQ